MPRSKSYDRDEAVTRACHAFWVHGYSALGVRALEKLTGLNKFAIRTEFGGKEGLYLEALHLYVSTAREMALAPLRTGGACEIRDFFQSLVTGSSPTSSRYGCLIVNTGVENAELQSAALENVTRGYWAMLAEHFHGALARERQAGRLTPEVEPEMAAQALVTAVMGIHTANRTAGRHDAGKPLADMVCGLIDSWAVRPLS